MKRTLLLSLILSAAGFGSAVAQTADATVSKLDPMARMILQRAADAPATRGTSATTDQFYKFVITTDDAEAAADSIRQLGGRATVIDGHVLTARFKAGLIAPVSRINSVRRITLSRQSKLTMDASRSLTGADKVQEGTDLETPYTGKGVIVGVIDQGMQYNHVAFKDANGNTRIKGIWNYIKDDEAQPATSTTDKHDGATTSRGHATHVTNIAAGSAVIGNAYSGMAPEADIMVMSSSLYDDEILEGVKWISETAKSEGKPWVLNMSFGSQYGPHDGTSSYDVTANNFCGEGGLIVASMGNEGGENIHASYNFTQTNDTVYLFLSELAAGDMTMIGLWNNSADSVLHYDVTPCVYNTRFNRIWDVKEDVIKQSGEFVHAIDPDNQKEAVFLYYDMEMLVTVGNYQNASYIRPGLRIVNKTGTTGFHAWSCQQGEFERFGDYGLEGDDNYIVCQSSASIPAAIGVASYTGSADWKCAYNNSTYTTNQSLVVGALSSYSSPGPSLGPDLRPTVAAPGDNVKSAFNSYAGPDADGTLNIESVRIVGAVDSNGKAVTPYRTKANATRHFFYGVLSGTSMAAPAVTGIVALWLQANPTLTPDQVKEIIRTTALRDDYTGTDEWDAKRGYGKIDAYEGLKKALALADAAGIDQTVSNDTPVTISTTPASLRILFNTVEPTANITLVRLDGTTADARRLSGLKPGSETVLNFADYAPGVYVVSITTAHAVVTRKVVIR